MCHVDYTCPRCGRMEMAAQDYGNTYNCLRCGRIEQNPPPWTNRDRRKGERRGAGERSYAEGMAFKRAETDEELRRREWLLDAAHDPFWPG